MFPRPGTLYQLPLESRSFHAGAELFASSLAAPVRFAAAVVSAWSRSEFHVSHESGSIVSARLYFAGSAASSFPIR